MRFPGLVLFAFSALFVLVTAWTKEDHEIFRLRDEVEHSEGKDVTFYNFLGVSSSASQDEIAKAYRKKSRLLHPDKAKQAFLASRATPNHTPGKGPATKPKSGVHVAKAPSAAEVRTALKQADQRFARLGVVVNILRGPGRERYDHFLKNGFPSWRGTGYYYARYRPGLGAVLLGLFVVGGGAGHYAALYIGWKRQKEFVHRYIREARRSAWGDDFALNAIPGLGESTSTAPGLAQSGDGTAHALNRRQRRTQEKESKKGKAARPSEGPESNPAPTTPRKRVTAANGKVLFVDTAGNVYLEQEDEDGQTEQLLLDVNEIRRPTITQTILFQAPLWLYHTAVDRVGGLVQGRSHPAAAGVDTSSSSDSEVEAVTVEAAAPSAPNGRPTGRAQRTGRA
ncbi:MAG: hypothetical protein M1826_000222 [Phylliscum demangeonii]|nr:MAG: hypothetical protein M1826_000222 [Phylliscum demangeonii]